MSVVDVCREISEFRAAYAAGILTPLDGWELAHSITGTGVEYYSSRPVMSATELNNEVVLLSELSGLIEDLGGTVPSLPRSEDDIEIAGVGAGGALIKVILPIAMKLRLEWHSRQSAN